MTFKDNVQDLDYANNEFKNFIKRLNYHYVLYNLVQKINVQELQEIWKHGFIKINSIDNVDNVGAYVCKYMTKADDDRLLGRRMYFNSRGLNRPQEIKEPDLIAQLQKSLLNQALKYENTFTNDYNSVNYRQYIIK